MTRFAALILLPMLLLASCATNSTRHVMLVSVRDQKMAVYQEGSRVATYPISTSKFGLGDKPGSNRTPIGKMEVARKIGGGQPLGMVFKGRRPTGEVLRPNAPGRDPIVTRILWLRGN
ncbi:L,D-transpeptidase, partial [bacterium]|nr:L,D-transpeptidase [bacterium]